jgi:hypothetical protein
MSQQLLAYVGHIKVDLSDKLKEALSKIVDELAVLLSHPLKGKSDINEVVPKCAFLLRSANFIILSGFDFTKAEGIEKFSRDLGESYTEIRKTLLKLEPDLGKDINKYLVGLFTLYEYNFAIIEAAASSQLGRIDWYELYGLANYLFTVEALIMGAYLSAEGSIEREKIVIEHLRSYAPYLEQYSLEVMSILRRLGIRDGFRAFRKYAPHVFEKFPEALEVLEEKL